MLSVMQPNTDLRLANSNVMKQAPSPLFNGINTNSDMLLGSASLRLNTECEPFSLFTNQNEEISKTLSTDKKIFQRMDTVDSPSFSVRSPYFGSSLSSSLSYDNNNCPHFGGGRNSPHMHTTTKTHHHHGLSMLPSTMSMSMSMSPHHHPMHSSKRDGDVISPHTMTQSGNMTMTNHAADYHRTSHHQDGIVYQVQFKFTLRYCTSHTTHCIGDFVNVDMNPGIHIGIVTEIYPMSQYIHTKVDSLRNLPFVEPEDVLLHQIIHTTTLFERQQLSEKYQFEQNITSYVEKLTYLVHKLPMIIHGVEFQFDKTKLIIFYSAEYRIDFRDLVKNIFAMCKVRIWMKRIGRENSVCFNDAVQAALATGMTITEHSFQPSKY